MSSTVVVVTLEVSILPVLDRHSRVPIPAYALRTVVVWYFMDGM